MVKPHLPQGGLDGLSCARETELLRDALRLACRAAERDLMQSASKGHWTDGCLGELGSMGGAGELGSWVDGGCHGDSGG